MTSSSYSFFDKIRYFLRGFSGKAVSYIELELEEMEHVFALLIMGAFVGIPSPPTSIVMRIMPYAIREIMVITKKTGEADDILGEFSEFFEL